MRSMFTPRILVLRLCGAAFGYDMPCYHPIPAWMGKTVNASGKRSPVFKVEQGFADKPLSLPCGNCIGCRLERSRQWAIRCFHEASLYDRNCFLTLTYASEFLPPNGSLVVADLQRFMKRLRKRFSSQRIRFFACGEYGEKLGRPHYHLCLFGFDFDDKVFYKKSPSGEVLYVSMDLENLWPFGSSTIGSVTFESAAYAARYIVDKVNGEPAGHHYKGRKEEFVLMSRRPGIAREWYERFKGDVFPSDTVVLRGREMRPPDYYYRLLEKEESLFVPSLKAPSLRESLKVRHAALGAERADDSLTDRLFVREAVAASKLKAFSKRLIHGD